MNLRDYVTEQGITYQSITNETGIGGNRLNRLRAGSRPTNEEVRRIMMVTEWECDEFRDDPSQGYKRGRG